MVSDTEGRRIDVADNFYSFKTHCHEILEPLFFYQSSPSEAPEQSFNNILDFVNNFAYESSPVSWTPGIRAPRCLIHYRVKLPGDLDTGESNISVKAARGVRFYEP